MVLRFLRHWRLAPGPAIVPVAAYCFVILSLCALAAQATGQLAGMVAQLVPALTETSSPPVTKPADALPAAPEKAAMSVPHGHTQGSVVLTQGWGGYGRDRSLWRERDAWRKRDRERHDNDWWNSRDGDDNDERRPDQSNTSRTVCVRLCDGYYWPISYATTPENFDRDRQKCESSCGSPARLYRGRTGSEIDDMEDQNGQPYRRLKTAFLYRTQYEASCKCKAEPWSKEATDRHRIYALEAAKAKGDKVAAQQLNEMKAAREAERRQALTAARHPSGTAGTSSTVATNAAAESADQAPATGTHTTHQPAANGRMGLGARPPAPPSRSSGRPMRTWSDRSDASP
ncbi:MAG: DUF2865 domain-containing protein [Hyphomicrobiaceae bacterium]